MLLTVPNVWIYNVREIQWGNVDIKWKLYKLRVWMRVPHAGGWQGGGGPTGEKWNVFLSVMVKKKKSKIVPDPTMCPTAHHDQSQQGHGGYVSGDMAEGGGGGGSRVRRSEEWGGGGSVGGVRVNASGSFCGWSHWRGGRSILPATVCLREINRETNMKWGGGGLVYCLHSHYPMQSKTVRYKEWKSWGQV